MTDIDHYAEAVQYLALAEDAAFRTAEGATAMAAIAQVHATLATVPPYPQTAEDLRGAQAEIDRLQAIVDGIQSEATVERVARAICQSREHLEGFAVCPSSRRDARAALEALGGPDA